MSKFLLALLANVIAAIDIDTGLDTGIDTGIISILPAKRLPIPKTILLHRLSTLLYQFFLLRDGTNLLNF